MGGHFIWANMLLIFDQEMGRGQLISKAQEMALKIQLFTAGVSFYLTIRYSFSYLITLDFTFR